MPILQASNSTPTIQFHQVTIPGPSFTAVNDTTSDVWPIWVAASNAVLQNAIGMPDTGATHRVLQAGLQNALNQAVAAGMPTGITAGNNQIWTIWNESYTSASTTVITPRIITASSTGTSAQIWGAWNEAYGSGTITIGAAMPTRILSEAEHEAARVARATDEAKWRERNAAAQAEEEKAKDRAEKLLLESLNAKQSAELRANGYFELDVISKNGNSRRYRIHRRWSHSIHQIDPSSGQRLKTLCIHPGMQVPIADSMLAQKLMLESGMEEDLLRIANHS